MRIRRASRSNAGAQNSYMPVHAYAGMTDADIKSMYAYLRTLKPIVNKVEKIP